MYVHMRHALADSVVHRDERSVGAEPLLNGERDALHLFEERADLPERYVEQRLAMPFRDDQAMAVEDRAPVEKHERLAGFVHDMSRQLAAYHAAEKAIRDGSIDELGQCVWLNASCRSASARAG